MVTQAGIRAEEGPRRADKEDVGYFVGFEGGVGESGGQGDSGEGRDGGAERTGGEV